MALAVVGGDVTIGAPWRAVDGVLGLRAAPALAGATEVAGATMVVTGDTAVAEGGAPAEAGGEAAGEALVETLRPGAVRAATSANKPAPATAEAVTARLTRVNRRTA
jgi:hypothetical protein